jgi:hypothetical protein
MTLPTHAQIAEALRKQIEAIRATQPTHLRRALIEEAKNQSRRAHEALDALRQSRRGNAR